MSLSAREREALGDVVHIIEPQLDRKVESTTVHRVIDALMRAVTHDVRLHSSGDESQGKTQGLLILPATLSASDCLEAAKLLDSESGMGGDRSGFSSRLHTVAMEHVPKLIANVREWKDVDLSAFCDALSATLRVSARNAAFEEWTKNDHFAFAAFAGVNAMTIRDCGNNFEHSLRLMLFIFSKSQEAREQIASVVEHLPLLPFHALGEAIVRQGYRTLLSMEAATEYDVWQNWRDAIVRHANFFGDAMAEVAKVMESDYGILPNDDEEPIEIPKDADRTALLLESIDDDHQEMWKKANEYLASHTQTPRRKLLDVIDAERCRKELEQCRSEQLWGVLGAKEREIVNRVFCEVARIPYAYTSGEHLLNQGDQSFAMGTPTHAASQNALTCFTGPWLLAALLMECGIPYASMYFCELHDNPSSPLLKGAHCSLFIRFSDGTSGFFDLGDRHGNRAFILSCLEEKEEREVRQFFHITDAYAEAQEKYPGDPITLHMPPGIADKLKVSSDFRMMSLDQGFTAGMLYHTGIALEASGSIDEARVAYELALISDRGCIDILHRLAELEYAAGNEQRGDILIDRILEKTPDYGPALYRKGVRAAALGDLDLAHECFEAVFMNIYQYWGAGDLQLRAMNADALVSEELLRQQADVRSFLTDEENHLL